MVDNYYDSIADGYDKLYKEEQINKLAIIKSQILIKKDSNILDIGCGSGISSNFDCNVIGIDPSKNLIEIAKKNDKMLNHKYLVESAENMISLKFSDKQFDFVLSISAIHHVKKLEKLIPELKRIGKKFIFSILNRISSKEKIINIINNNFKITKTINESKDIILFFE